MKKDVSVTIHVSKNSFKRLLGRLSLEWAEEERTEKSEQCFEGK